MIKKIALAGLLVSPALASAEGLYFFAGAASGSTDLSAIEATYFPPYTVDDEVQRALIGLGVSVNQYLAFEGLYMTQVENKVETPGSFGYVDTLEHQGLQLAVIGKVPVGPQFSLFGKLTANSVVTTYHYEDKPVTEIYEEEQGGAYLGFGAGAEFQFNDKVSARLQYERIQLRDINIVGLNGIESADFDVDQASVAVSFHF